MIYIQTFKSIFIDDVNIYALIANELQMNEYVNHNGIS